MCQNKPKDNNCIAEILTIICLLQSKSKKTDKCLDSCDKAFLGDLEPCHFFNTRPIMIYTCCGNGTPWAMPVFKESDSCTSTSPKSCVFRVEKISDNCATFRVLVSCNKPGKKYEPTNSIFTMNLDCICAIRCLRDTYVDVD